MAIAFASWVHGHAGRIEHPDRLARIVRFGWALEITGRERQETWIHYSIPTPVIVQDRRLLANAVLIRYRVPSPGDSTILSVHIYDGERNLLASDTARLRASEWEMARINVPGNPAVQWGIGLSLGVRFARRSATADATRAFHIHIAAVGCDFAAPG